MQPNPLLRKLGFSNDTKVAIIHTDDIGMCQASVSAFAELVDFGLISCGSTMVPCPWFLEAAAYCREHPGVDMGVHLTLTSEWETYRWGPLSSRDVSTSLLDEEGCFHRRSEDVQALADPGAVMAEMQAQVERALRSGISVTHIDTHMGTVAHQKFMSGYLQVAMQYCIPAMVFRLDEDGWRARGLDAETAAMAARVTRQLEGEGWPLLDGMSTIHLDKPDNRLEQARQALSSLPAGVTHFIIHPSKDTPELRAITSDWPSRVADFETFSSPILKDYVRKIGIQVIGYAAIKQFLPGRST
jgi:predicted glycoside hydrolase/deacetylase ChbG (UPF0249 family)